MGLPGLYSGLGSCVGGHGALSGSGIGGDNGSLVSMCKYLQREDSAAGALRHQRNKTTVGRIVPPYRSLDSKYGCSIFRGWSLLHSV